MLTNKQTDKHTHKQTLLKTKIPLGVATGLYRYVYPQNQ